MVVESSSARRLVRRRIVFVNEKRRIGPRRARKEEEEETVGAKVGDIRRWNRFVTMIEAVDENVSYFLTDLLFARSVLFPSREEFNSSSISAQTIGGVAAAWDQRAFFAEQFGLDDRRHSNDASLHHSATAKTVMSPPAIFDENVERESIILGILAKGQSMRTRIVCRET